ncbi:hypothetical protein ACFX13_003720 [Malus domestica]
MVRIWALEDSRRRSVLIQEVVVAAVFGCRGGKSINQTQRGLRFFTTPPRPALQPPYPIFHSRYLHCPPTLSRSLVPFLTKPSSSSIESSFPRSLKVFYFPYHQIPDAAAAADGLDARGGPRCEASEEKGESSDHGDAGDRGPSPWSQSRRIVSPLRRSMMGGDEEVGDDLGGSETRKVKYESEKCGGEGDLGVCLDGIGWVFGWEGR